MTFTAQREQPGAGPTNPVSLGTTRDLSQAVPSSPGHPPVVMAESSPLPPLQSPAFPGALVNHPPVAAYHGNASVGGSGDCFVQRVCAWCHLQMGTTPCDVADHGRVTHGICEPCRAQFNQVRLYEKVRKS